MSRRRSKKPCPLIGQNIPPDPLVGSGNPPHRRQTCTTAHPTRAHHRMVALAKSSPSRSTPRPSQKESATVMLERFPASLNLFCILGFPNSCKSDSVFAISSDEDDHGKGLFDGLEGLRCGLGRGWREPA